MVISIPAIKLGTQIVAGLGVSKIAGDIIRNNVVVMTRFQAVSVKVGTFVIGSILVEQSSNHIERVTNEIVTMLENQRDKNSKK
jgi:hypothetical protein